MQPLIIYDKAKQENDEISFGRKEFEELVDNIYLNGFEDGKKEALSEIAKLEHTPHVIREPIDITYSTNSALNVDSPKIG